MMRHCKETCKGNDDVTANVTSDEMKINFRCCISYVNCLYYVTKGNGPAEAVCFFLHAEKERRENESTDTGGRGRGDGYMIKVFIYMVCDDDSNDGKAIKDNNDDDKDDDDGHDDEEDKVNDKEEEEEKEYGGSDGVQKNYYKENDNTYHNNDHNDNFPNVGKNEIMAEYSLDKLKHLVLYLKY